MATENKFALLEADVDPSQLITAQKPTQAAATKVMRHIRQRRYSDCGQTFRGEQCGGRFIRKAEKDENTVSSNKEFFEDHTTIGYEDGDEYEYKKARKPYGRHIYHGFCGGYLTNGEVAVEGGLKKRIFDRRSYTGYKTGTKRVRADWGSHDDDIAQAAEMYMDDVNGYEMKLDSDNDLEYEDLADEDELFIASENVTGDNRKSF